MKTTNKIPKLSKLVKKGSSERWLDTPSELRIRLHNTASFINGIKFYHERECPKEEQIISATYLPSTDVIDVVLFIDKMEKTK